MNYHVDRSIVLSESSEFPSLYRWFLRESGGNAKAHDRDQIPWPWTLYFLLDEICLISTIGHARFDSSADANFAKRTFIKAKLRPNHQGSHAQTCYYMFGTNRPVEEFELYVEQFADEQPDETCTAWGGVSYTTDIDFRNETIPDSISITLRVNAETFANYADKIATKMLDAGTLRIGLVSGFYSDWSPGISTSRIKILVGDKEAQPVAIPEGCLIEPPRLGKVGDFQLMLQSTTSLRAESMKKSSEYEKDAEQTPDSVEAETAPPSEAATVGMLKSIRIVGWLVVLLLLLLVVFKR